jgi:hypothetical protein
MARRPQVEKNILSREELDSLKHRLSLLSPNHVRQEYLAQLERCRLEREVPPPYVIQRLVVMWKLLWKWRRT